MNGSPAVDGKVTVVGGCDARVHIVSVTDGHKVGEVDAGAYIAASVALEGGRAYVGHYDNEVLCVDIPSATVAWIYKDRNFPYFSSAALGPKQVLVGGRDRRLHCIDRNTGAAIWAFRAQGKVDSSPVIVGDKVLFGAEDGRLYLLRLADGAEVWSHEIGQGMMGSPAVTENLVVIGAEDGAVYAFEPPRR